MVRDIQGEESAPFKRELISHPSNVQLRFATDMSHDASRNSWPKFDIQTPAGLVWTHVRLYGTVVVVVLVVLVVDVVVVVARSPMVTANFGLASITSEYLPTSTVGSTPSV
jgi:hypothetical protein